MPQVEPTPLTPTDPGPVMISWAHRPNTGVAEDEWTRQVADLAFALRRFRVDADVDLFHLSEVGIDWTRWGPTRIRQCARTLVVVNTAWRQRFEGTNAPTEGAGAVAEANELLGMFAEDQVDFRRRVVLVILPEAAEDDVPTQLRGLQHARVTRFDESGMEDLLRLLTGQPAYPMPPLGTVPLLPPRTQQALEGITQVIQPQPRPPQRRVGTPTLHHSSESPAVAGATVTTNVSASLSAVAGANVRAEVLPTAAREQKVALQAWAASLRETVNTADASSHDEEARARPSRVSAPGPAAQETSQPPAHVPVAVESEDERRALGALLERVLTALEQPPPPPAGAPALSLAPDTRTAAVHRLDGLLREVSAHLERDNRCWLLLAGALEDPEVAASGGHDGRSQRQRRQEQVSGWILRMLPPVPLGQEPTAVRAPARVVFPGEPVPPATGARSSTWRLELTDNGDAVMAANVAGEVAVQHGTGHIGWPGEPGEVLLDAELYLPVRRDLLELWLLTQVELLAEHLNAVGAPVDAGVHLQVRLLLPERLVRPATRRVRGTAVRVVDERRDEDGHPLLLGAMEGARDLPVGSPPPTVGPVRARVADLSHPPTLVRLTRTLAVELLEHFGVEDTSVLRADGVLDELAAAAADQQAVWQHAGALGLPKDPISPEQRRQRYDELLAQARAALRR